MLKQFCFIITLICAGVHFSFADVTQQDIDRAIKISELQHPYLHFSEKDKPAILERIQNDTVCRDIMARLIAEANRLIYTPVETKAPERVDNPRFNASWEFERYLTNNTNSAYNLAFMYQMTGEEKYAEKAFEFIDVVCNQPTWVHGAHEFPIIYDRVWPWGASDDQVVFSYAQWTDHMVFKIAAAYDWLYPGLEKRQRDRIRSALLEKAITRVRGNYEYHWWAAAYRCNWCAVLNSSLGVASIALLTEDPQLTDVIAESHNRISKTLDQIHDGGWQEGIGYLSYTVNYSLIFADVLKRVTGGKQNLYKHPQFKDAVNTFIYCQIPPNRSVHFGDSGGGGFGSYTMFNDLMLETGNKQAAWLRKHFTGDQPVDVSGFFKPRSTLEPALPEIASIHFPAVDWVIMRSDFTDREKVLIAGKSGRNNDPHHGHLDVGHFSLYWRGKEFLCDHGSAGYDRKYFDKERWDYSLASSIGHNVVQVNGERQIHGKLKNQPWNLDIGGKIIEFRPGKKRDYTLMDPTNAYPKKEMKHWRRHIILDKPVVTVVLDEITCKKGAEIEARFHSAVSQGIRKDWVLLNSGSDRMAVIPVVDGDFNLREDKHTILMAQKNAKLRLVPYFGTVVNAEKEKTIIAHIILPVNDENDANKIKNSVKRSVDNNGNLTLSFVKDDETFSYMFKKGKDGLVF